MQEAHPHVRLHLGRAAIRELCRRQFRRVLADTHQNRTFRGGMLLSAGISLSRWICRNIPQSRVGIVLPPGAGAAVANLACVLAGKTPVNLNFTLSRDQVQSAIDQAGIEAVLTANELVHKLPENFPWPTQRFHLPEILSHLKLWILFWRLLVLITPPDVLANTLRIPKKGGDAECAILFTSGSSGAPKGAVLSHQNVLANVAQITEVLPPAEISSLLGCLPVFHSFGFTVTLWWPILGGPPVVNSPSPLETARLAHVIEEHEVALMITTPTFLRNFLRKAKPEQLRSLKMIVTGAEKLPQPLRREFEEKFSIPVCEGYGTTETSPVVSVNLIDFSGKNNSLRLRKDGTTGKPLPWIEIKTLNLETAKDQPATETGILCYRGPNVFRGYLNRPELNEKVLKKGWYISGDIGRLDEEGFLIIEGRQSRFTKIGGEMVPHGVVEQKIHDVLVEVDPKSVPHDQPSCIVVGVETEEGERLAALVVSGIETHALRQKLREHGLPNLWVPKTIKQVEKIPLLASGKFDLANARGMARE